MALPSFWHYGEDRDDETASDEDSAENWGANGELVLGDDGKVELDLPTPPPHKVSLPQTVSIYADVTDVNQQTISTTTEFRLPGADFIVGARKSSWSTNAGKEFGEIRIFRGYHSRRQAFSPQRLQLQVKIERQEWNTVRVEAAGGGVTTKNQSHRGAGPHGAARQRQWPGQLGTPRRRRQAAHDGNRTWQASAYPRGFLHTWSGSSLVLGSGAQDPLRPDGAPVKPGEEVSIVVKSPIAGKALVTVERNRIHRQFLTSIAPENPVIKVKIDEEEQTPSSHCRHWRVSPLADAEYKVGYCDITVK
ncbi:MAG: hypothetical protein QM796_21365 [Chthoniobacteraceae bacterium]